jgi:hypothetical protein
MTPKTFSVIAVLLLGAVSLTNSHPVAVPRQESVQNSFKRSFPQTVYPQETVQKSMLNIQPASKMVYGQEYPQKSVQQDAMKPVSPSMYAQEAAAAPQNDIMARIAVDECSQVYRWCRASGEYSWLTCTGVLTYCRLNPVQRANQK